MENGIVPEMTESTFLITNSKVLSRPDFFFSSGIGKQVRSERSLFFYFYFLL